jgi:hypothetical protein
MLIGLSGRKFSGKDTVASYLANDYERRKFADKLKRMVSVLLDCSLLDLENQTFKESKVLGDLTGREILQTLGTDWGRNLDENIWVNAAMYGIRIDDKIVFSDVRFPNEVKAIKDRGGKVIRIERLGMSIDNHPSETALDDYKDWDYIIRNYGSLESLVGQVKDMREKLFI